MSTKKLDPGALESLLSLEDSITQVSRRLAAVESSKVELLREYRGLSSKLDDTYARIAVDLDLPSDAVFRIDTKTGEVVVDSVVSPPDPS